MSDESGSAGGSPVKTIKISKSAIIIAVSVVLILVVGAYVLTFVLPRGEYQRDASGSIIAGTYRENPSLDGVKWWQFLLSPLMILSPSSPGFEVVYVIIALLLLIGAIFYALDDTGILIYMIESLAHRFRDKKYYLIFVISFAFMFLGSAVGMFEELIPLVPIVVMLSYAFGWDALVGLGISILAACFGFSAGVVNPFTVGVAQTLGHIELFSGIEMRLLTFVVAYIILVSFIFPYAKMIEKKPFKSSVFKLDAERKKEFNFHVDDFKPDPVKGKALKWFGLWMCFIIVCSLVAIFWRPLADYIMYITVVVYIIAGVGASVMCGLKGKRLFKLFGKGMLALMPAIAMILVAGGVRYIIDEGDIMDTILYKAVGLIENSSPDAGIFLIYAIIFVFEMFIPSGSAKAFLIMPIIFDLCSIVGIHPQVAVLTFAYADGFANVFLPTNAGLLLILGLTTVNYPKWFKWSVPIQFTLLLATLGILMLAQNVVYA
jgi:Predicted membrane protein